MTEAILEGIAIIGVHGRFPGADSVDAFWANLVAGRENISFFTDAELAAGGLDPAALRRAGPYVPARGVLKDAECFDAAFFGIHPKEAEVMDPQQRVFLEVCWEALERAGYAPGRISGAVGVYAGATFNTYYLHALHPRPELRELVGHEQVMLGNEKDYLATRVAYKLNLNGPALSLNTACSSSLVAVCQACQALLTYQCDLALAGGVSVRVPQQSGYFYQEGNIASPDGHTRTFDAFAQGTVFSNGVTLVVLKRLADALADGDQIYAAIKGAALNNDGSQRVSFGAPGVEGQSEVVALAQEIAGFEPDSISYVEAHGTATPIGDPIEVAALTKAFRRGTQRKQFCALGSVKSNVGHLDAAAGTAGLIKTALALKHRLLPPSLHFQNPNPKLDLENSPFFVNAKLREWNPENGTPLRAGVSSFGTGGTNAHVVLEEAPSVQPGGPSRPWQILLISAKTPEALEAATRNLAEYLKREPEADLADVAYTLQVGRSEFTHRRVILCQNRAEAVALLEKPDPRKVFTAAQELREPPVVFMFPGQGAQYVNMGKEVYGQERVFREVVDQCAQILQPILGVDLRSVLFAPAGSEEAANEQLRQTRYTQPALFTIEYALARLWMSWGVTPSAMIGHSVGEYVAGCLAGVFSLEEALMLVARRAQLVQAQAPGSMLAVRLPEAEIQPFLNGNLSIAAINSPNLCVVSGPHEAVADLEQRLAAKGFASKALHTSHAFHSAMMEPVVAPFTDLLRQSHLAEPQIPYVSNVTARWITAKEATSPDYWARHVRQTVRFAEGVAELLKDSRQILLEVGPGHTLFQLARQHPDRKEDQPIIGSLGAARDQESPSLLAALGRLWLAGAAVDWKGFYEGERRRRVVLPTYPFERKRCWPQSPMTTPVSTHGLESVVQSDHSKELVALPHDAGSVASGQVVATPATSRKSHLESMIRSLVQDLSGTNLDTVEAQASFLELGLDSLLLTQAATLFQRKFGVAISFRQLMEDLYSIDSLTNYLDEQLPAGAFTPAAAPSAPGAASTAVISSGALEQLLQQQLQTTTQLLAVVRGQSITMPALPTAPALVPAAPTPVVAKSAKSEYKAHGPFRPVDRGSTGNLTEPQQRMLDALIARYTRRTVGSKKIASENRPLLADPRSAAGFKQIWKEMVYPIVTSRSDGSKVWDVDGNEYVDFVMGFGASLFGHRPPFVVQAVHEQLDRGFEIGPIQPLAGEVAALLRDFTGLERFGFTNTGSEAVLAATRVARTVTGRDKIAVFAGAYHGIFDEVLFRPITVNGETRTAPIAPGIPDSALSQVLVLDYGNPQSLEILRTRGAEIAAVLVEPVQSRRLDLQPQEFLHELRRITEQTGTALIFDEVVTGFRVHPGGAQAHFGVQADLATYGKVVGGGLPIGVVAGRPKFMDALDGGQWQYGDTSFPEVGVSFFAGTFVRHPLALAAAKAVLTHLKQSGPELQSQLAERTARTAAQLRDLLAEFHTPYHVTQFSSLLQLVVPPEMKFGGLLYYLLRERGIHIWENRAFVFTTAHTDDDLGELMRAFRESLSELQAGEFLPAPEGATKGTSSLPAREPTETPADRDRATAFPLTEAQEEIWLATQMGGKAAIAYNESLSFHFRGSFDVAVFRESLRRVVERHPILLVSISDDGQSQRVRSDAKVEASLVDLSPLNADERERELAALLDREASEAFDLTAGPLFRAKIVRMSNDRHVALWTAHHIVCDGWSGGLLIGELASSYSALKQGRQPALEIPASFREFAERQNAEAASPAGRDALTYWQRQFAEMPPLLELPLDRSRPPVRSARAATLNQLVGAALPQKLKQAAARERTTTVVFLMAAFKTLLHRLTNQTDLVLGLPVAGQAFEASPILVGHCVNLVPIRTRLSPEASFRENLAAVKSSVLDAYDHRQSTIGTILQHLSFTRSAGRPPLVEIMFNLDRDPSAARFEGVEFTCERTSKRALHFDLFLNFVEKQSGLFLECDYNSDLWDETTIERWVGHLQTLLESVTANPGESLAGLTLLTMAERHQLLSEWNNETRRDYPKDVCLHGLVEAQAQRTPDAVALIDARQRLTYRELNLRADQLAAQLRTLGIGPAVLTGVCVERSVEMVVALLAILKAGGAYVPLDPAFPRDRLAFMIQDSGMRLILTESRLLATVPADGVNLVCLDALPRVELPAAPTARGASAEDLAYVLYTSGSTGQPKGVQIPHRAVVNFLKSMQREPGLQPDDTVLALTTLSFDIAGLELFLPLVTGAKVVVASREDVIDGHRLAKLMAASRVSVAQATPAAWRMLLESGWQGDKSLKILCGGEAIPPDLAERLLGCCGELWNMYGPTETTIWSTTCRLNAGVPITIGRPIANTEIFILDGRQQPVPVGVLGELYVGGDGLARGYHNRPELTEEKFVRHPFNPAPGARLYRTGDLARYRTDGSIEFQGRIDHQVKIRGFRIELGEIESVLCQHSSVRQGVVMARGEASGNRRLVAYLIGETPTPTVSELQEHLRRKLPEYMVPGAFVFLEKFPLTNNGKINRQALPEPEQERPELAAAYVAPRTGIEATLAEIWSEVLEVERIGVHDHFFELGGHSLLAVRTISRIRQQLEVDMPLSTLFDAPTVAQLAVKVVELQAANLDGQDLALLLEELEMQTQDDDGDRSGDGNDSDKELTH